MNTSRQAHARLKQLINGQAIVRATGGKPAIVLNSGELGTWLIDLRMVLLTPEGLTLAAELFWERMARRFPFQIGGLVMASVPLIAAIITEGKKRGYEITGFIIRKERKTTGLCKSIEGPLTELPIVIVDDLLNGGDSFEQAASKLQDAGKKVQDLFVLIDYGNPHGHTKVRQHGAKTTSLYNLAEFDLKLSRGNKKPLTQFRQVWRSAAPNPNYGLVVPKSTPALDSDRIYFGSDTGFFYCLDQKTGRQIWSYQTGGDSQHKGILSSPAIHKNRVFFGAYDGSVYCLHAKSGKLLWQFTNCQWVGSSPLIIPQFNLLIIGLEHNTPGRRGSVIALDLTTGAPIWEYFVRELLHGSASYNQKQQTVIIGTNDAELLCLQAATGKLIWKADTGEEVKYAPVFSNDGKQVITGGHDGMIRIFEAKSGRELWQVQTNGVVYATPLIIGNKAYVTSTDKYLYILNLKTKKVLKKIYGGGKLWSSPRKIGRYIYYGSSNGCLYELDPRHDTITGLHQLPEQITTGITYSTKYKLLYVFTYDQRLFALQRLQSPKRNE